MTIKFVGGPLDGAKIDVREPEPVYFYPTVAHEMFEQRHKYQLDRGARYVYAGAEAAAGSRPE